MTKRFCIVCGRPESPETPIVEGLCPRCFLERHGLADLPVEVKAEICRFCGALRVGWSWRPTNGFEDALKMIAERVIPRLARPRASVSGFKITGWKPLSTPSWTTKIELYTEGVLGGVRVEWTPIVTVRLKPSTCPRCKMDRSGDYVAVVQFRGFGEEELGLLARKLSLERHSKILDVVQSRAGLDVYFSERGAARRLARLAVKILGARMSESRESVGVDSKGRGRVRTTIIVRPGAQRIKL